jgi:hypothetical protein
MSVRPKKRQRTQVQEQLPSDGVTDGEDSSPRLVNRQASGSRPTTPTQMVPLYEKDLIRTLAEVNFINGEVIKITFDLKCFFLAYSLRVEMDKMYFVSKLIKAIEFGLKLHQSQH